MRGRPFLRGFFIGGSTGYGMYVHTYQDELYVRLGKNRNANFQLKLQLAGDSCQALWLVK